MYEAKPLTVNVYSVDNAGNETRIAASVSLIEACGDDIEAYWQASNEIKANGRAWVGGGAAPLFLLMRV